MIKGTKAALRERIGFFNFFIFMNTIYPFFTTANTLHKSYFCIFGCK